jgi:TPR repeat protein
MKIKMEAGPEFPVGVIIGGDLELHEAHRARQEERYTDALAWYEKSVALNNPKAMWELSQLYDDEIWGLIDIMGYMEDALILRSAALGFEPAMIDFDRENNRHRLTETPYYQRIIASKDPYVIAELHCLLILRAYNRGQQDHAEIKLLIKLYKEAISAGYFNCYARIYELPFHWLSLKERSNWLLVGAKTGNPYIQCELGSSCNTRCKEPRLIFQENDREALHWYLKAIKQLYKPAIKAAQKIYFDKTSECYDRFKGVDLVVLISRLNAQRQLKTIKDDHVSQYSVELFKTLIGRLRSVGRSHRLSDDDLREMWQYGRLLTTFPIIPEVLKAAPPLDGTAITKECLALYSECTDKARQAALAFLVAWRKSPSLWCLNRDVAIIIAKQIYQSRSDCRQWLAVLDP